jgi:hypothetical protein
LSFTGGFWPENRRDRVVDGMGISSTGFDQPGATMRYLLAAAMTMAMLTGPAYAQFKPNGQSKDPLTLKYEREDAERKENEKAYNETMKRLKAQGPATTKNDPWSGVRPASDSTAAKR